MTLETTIPSLQMAIPFAGVLLSISLLPLLLPKLWHRFENWILLGWALLSLAMITEVKGITKTGFALTEIALHEYLPFIILLTTLYIISGGLHIRLKTVASPLTNTGFLLIGSLIASIVGTTGAAMLLIRPFIHMNRHRHYQSHNIVFFIFTVANVGGCLTPLGDPPLFLGYLNGVDFFWTLKHLFTPFLLTIFPILGIYMVVDWVLEKREKTTKEIIPQPDSQFLLEGRVNLFLLLGVLFVVVASNIPKGLPAYHILECEISLNQLLRDLGLIVLAIISYAITLKAVHKHHHFSWGPILEVARVFAAIFVTMIPVNMMLLAGAKGPFAPLLAFAGQHHPAFVYFWLTGIFSAFLDNAPTYLIFFKMAGGNAEILMGPMFKILMAISLGSVFMGALTYIGNAPNFMVRAIAKQSGVHMPSFLGYMVWSFSILLPIFLGVVLWLLW